MANNPALMELTSEDIVWEVMLDAVAFSEPTDPGTNSNAANKWLQRAEGRTRNVSPASLTIDSNTFIN
jgi:hypothetical protein